ncbi:MAG TPA: DUF2905 domain-containing protein [Leptospiraceae bacterium]|nr:DUF2905 domain-containing protein [Leptospiraceae bacterium]HMW05105.1 DUF2905 domain-containing protein [Leptospiraceae bacterium]HMX31359.1 DUF2905 domain-containing protein [Leptospiraceae bacterium]HMY31598.1 DUF2905 domain-containing protein [Leptospiraceae bacterium]HMZ66120.1 DUF2905 domain-containing protein [Leptospiraceae bacterium]
MESFGKNLIFLGVILLIVGALFTLSGKFPFIGNLPGDISIKKENFSFYFPLTTSILISILLSLIMWLWNR